MGTPDILLMVSEEVVVFDNLRGRIYIIVHLDPDAGDTPETGQARIDELVRRCSAARRASRRPAARGRETDFVSGFTEDGFKPPSSASRTTSSKATACRWCCRSACRSRSRRARWTCTGRCAGSTRRPTCTSSTSASSRSSARRRRS
jgi:hypothetical protein